ncbi:MAG: murD [Rickettsiaceae bacterium]|jgi:UDP-N-acetylmuramoylalanine--D-glutamate ligase|nr:murD [Rickettsiaceae bacterium]
MILNKQKDKKIGIFGLGKTGLSAYDALKIQASVICYDDSAESRNAFLKERPESSLVPIDDPRWLQLDKIILSPNIPLQFPKKHPLVYLAEQYNIEITSDMELLHEEFPEAPFVAITGTNGKSTTTALIGHILNYCNKPYQVGGNIGQACLTLEPPSLDNGYVLETSSYQLDLLKDFHLKVAVFLNITPDHIDRHGSLENYINAKKKIFNYLKEDSIAVIAIDNKVSYHVYQELLSQKPTYQIIPVSTHQSLKNGIYVEVHNGAKFIQINLPSEKLSIEFKQNKCLQGNHNLENILASFAVAKSLGCREHAILEAVDKFQGLPHRMQFIAETENIRFYNDSKATNADSAEKSLGSLENIYWLAGGLPKEGGIESLIYLKDRIKKAYLFGQAAEAFAKTLEGKVEYKIFKNLEEAFTEASNDAEQSNIEGYNNILLAPACASWDQFKNFEERGNKFIELVKKYTNLKKKI